MTRAIVIVGLAFVLATDDVEKEEGATLTCDAKLDGGGKAKVNVTQTSTGGDFTYSFKPGTVVLTDDAVEPALQKEQVACSATGSGGRQSELTFTFSSADGTIDESSVSG